MTRAEGGQTRGVTSLAPATALFVGPSLAALFDEKPDNRQRSDAIDPPRADNPLNGEANDDNH